jgi:hypothetical protein
MWRDEYSSKKVVDKGYRPSDQNWTSRNYGRMDNDLWDRMELRGWFDKYYTPVPLHHTDLEKTQYMKRPTPKEVRKWPLLPATAPGPEPPRMPRSPHWINHEGNVSTQRVRSDIMLQHSGPYLRHGCDNPWKDRPAHEEREGYTKLVPTHEIKRVHDTNLHEATRHAGDSMVQVQARVIQMNEGSKIFG